MNVQTLRAGATLLLLAALHGCGSGGSGVGGGGGTDAIEGSGKPSGFTNIGSIATIDDAATITVNGVTLPLTGASIDLDGRAIGADALRTGHVVTVRGKVDDDGAPTSLTSVSADLIVAGPIASTDATGDRFTILGQAVAIDAATHIEDLVDGQPLGGLTVGDDVEISGFADSTGVIYARNIAPRSVDTPLLVTGVVASLDTTARTMAINGQPVDYSTATLTGFDSAALDAAPVQVAGAFVTSDGALHATQVVYRDLRTPGAVDDLALLEGWVTRFASEKDFDVDGHPVTTTSSTQTTGLWDETVLGAVRLDAFVRVKGKVIANGVIEASEVTTNNIIDINARITRVEANVLEAGGRFAGIPCTLDNVAISVDGVPADWRALHIGDIATIHELFDPQTLGTPPPEGWSRPTRDPVCRIITVNHSVRGPIDSIDGAAVSLVVMGLKVWLSSSTVFHGTASGEPRLALESLQPGDMVEVSGPTTADGSIIASSIARSPAGRDYRIVSLASDVDTTRKQLQLGATTVDYTAAEVSEFPGEGPVEHDRVLVVATAPPDGGLLRASALVYAARPARGEQLNMLHLNGLITRFVSPTDYDIEGRKTVPLPNPPEDDYWAPQACEPAKMHANLSMSLLATVAEDGKLYQIFTSCGGGYNASFDSPSGNMNGPIAAIDTVNRTFTVAGVTFHLHPVTSFTFVDGLAQVDEAITLADLEVGDMAWLTMQGYADGHAVADSVFTEGTPGTSAYIEGRVGLVDRPDLSIGGITVHTNEQTDLSACPAALDPSFWSRLTPDARLNATIEWDGQRWVAVALGRYDCP